MTKTQIQSLASGLKNSKTNYKITKKSSVRQLHEPKYSHIAYLENKNFKLKKTTQ